METTRYPRSINEISHVHQFGAVNTGCREDDRASEHEPLFRTIEEASIAALVGTVNGVMRLADFIKESGALPNLQSIRNRFL
jgi:hypothetical protein